MTSDEPRCRRRATEHADWDCLDTGLSFVVVVGRGCGVLTYEPRLALAYLVGVRGRQAAPHPHHWGGLEGPLAPIDLPREEYSVLIHGSVEHERLD